MKKFDVISSVLLIIGGLNWGLYGAFQLDLVASVFGSDMALASRIVYVLVGLSAIYQAFAWRGMRYRWSRTTKTEPTHIKHVA